ncbi:MAG: hypothetical protein N3G76_02275 [Candidatus Micrarchaeota archaeon]|nr:hypothetical protein [Candidatus Micrarchaeota archaeon]
MKSSFATPAQPADKIPIRLLLRDKHGCAESHIIYANYGENLLELISRNFDVTVKRNELGAWITGISGKNVRIYEDAHGGIQGYVNNALPYVAASSSPFFLGFQNIAVTSEFELRMQYDPFLEDIKVPLMLRVKLLFEGIFEPLAKESAANCASCTAPLNESMRNCVSLTFSSQEIMYFTASQSAKEGIAFASICSNSQAPCLDIEKMQRHREANAMQNTGGREAQHIANEKVLPPMAMVAAIGSIADSANLRPVECTAHKASSTQHGITAVLPARHGNNVGVATSHVHKPAENMRTREAVHYVKSEGALGCKEVASSAYAQTGTSNDDYAKTCAGTQVPASTGCLAAKKSAGTRVACMHTHANVEVGCISSTTINVPPGHVHSGAKMHAAKTMRTGRGITRQAQKPKHPSGPTLIKRLSTYAKAGFAELMQKSSTHMPRWSNSNKCKCNGKSGNLYILGTQASKSKRQARKAALGHDNIARLIFELDKAQKIRVKAGQGKGGVRALARCAIKRIILRLIGK